MNEKSREPRSQRRRDVPGGLWLHCPGCSKMIYKNLMMERGNVCPECSFHFPITSEERIGLLCDPDTFVERPGRLLWNQMSSLSRSTPQDVV